MQHFFHGFFSHTSAKVAHLEHVISRLMHYDGPSVCVLVWRKKRRIVYTLPPSALLDAKSRSVLSNTLSQTDYVNRCWSLEAELATQVFISIYVQT
jgi:hypothetical protein